MWLKPYSSYTSNNRRDNGANKGLVWYVVPQVIRLKLMEGGFKPGEVRHQHLGVSVNVGWVADGPGAAIVAKLRTGNAASREA